MPSIKHTMRPEVRAVLERAMYELENNKALCMTVREPGAGESGHVGEEAVFSPPPYAHATWHRVAPFFRSPGLMREEQHSLLVELRPFHDPRFVFHIALITSVRPLGMLRRTPP
jgi:hypothetical protein